MNTSSGRGPLACRSHFAGPTETAELDHLARLGTAGRLTLIEGRYQLAPGVELVEVGGYTPAS